MGKADGVGLTALQDPERLRIGSGQTGYDHSLPYIAPFALYTKLFGQSVSMDIGTQGRAKIQRAKAVPAPTTTRKPLLRALRPGPL